MKVSKHNASMVIQPGHLRKVLDKSDGWRKAAAAAGIRLSTPTEPEEFEELEEDQNRGEKRRGLLI